MTLAARVKRLLSRSIDGHADVREYQPRSGYLPFLPHVTPDGVVAVQPDRSGLLEPGTPYLTAIDELPIDAWLSAVQEFVPRGTSRWVREKTVSGLVFIQEWRIHLGRATPDTVSITLSDGERETHRTLTVTDTKPAFGVWPGPGSRAIGNVGYLRLPMMSPRAAAEIGEWLPRFRDMRGLIIDVRGNSGGSRQAFMPLLPYLVPPSLGPQVVNLAYPRQSASFDPAALEGRGLRPVTDARWTSEERYVIDAFLTPFHPAWTPPEGQFGAPHLMLLERGDASSFLNMPVVVLSDPVCLSATDVFLRLASLLPNVTLMGEGSGGSSGAPRVHRLPGSGLHVRLASMASFQPDGRLFDGHGVDVDVHVPPTPETFLQGGHDSLLGEALAFVRGA
ncbi:S41 family peptidase [Deinococcus enclensis]|uniref:Tail specific protease domain-containing protein n=1 Tax=Deinococcus enclensis TaxID=1049582 RepID=A0ABT9MIX0_9DEIO|nr:S41 family peptidase [Deinococcus enclensis]MDP9766533.1 hypothetical protein [Deinococcus enclensis]